MLMTDGVGGGQEGRWWQRNNNVVNQEILKMVFPSATVLSGFEFAGGYFLDNGVNYRIEGSNDGSTWTDLTGTQVFSRTTSASIYVSGQTTYKFPIDGNTAAYTHYRLYGETGQTDWNWLSEIYFGTLPIESSGLADIACNPSTDIFDASDDFITFTLDPKGGSGTYSVAIAGSTVTPSAGTFGSPTTFTLPAGSAGSGDLTMTLTGFTAGCDVVETISDPGSCLPGPCGEPDWNLAAEKASLTGDYHVPGNGCECGPLAVMVDNDISTGRGTKVNSYTNTAAFAVTFPQATVLHGMEVVVNSTNTEPITGGVMRVEGSNDGTNYTPVSIDFTHGTNLSAGPAQYGTGARAYTFPFADNTTAYIHYRIFAVSMSTRFGRTFNELYFDYDYFDAQLTNQGCADNGTFDTYTDDQVTFDLNPTPGAAGGTYTVEIDGGFTISPTSGTYGQVTSFTVSSGSSGAGDLNLTLTDASIPCQQVVVIPNTENACIPGPCGGPDWNVASEKVTITGMWDVPGTPVSGTEGPLAVFVDSDNASRILTKSNSFTNDVLFDCIFTEATVLHGMEVLVNETSTEPITAGVFRVEGSNDGVNFTTISDEFTFGSNLTAGAPQYTTGWARAYTFPFADNETAYNQYRIYAVSMSTRFNRSFNELYFDYDVFNPELTNISFGDNSTPGVFDDDVVNFDLNPNPGSGTYGLQVLGGYTILPSTGGTYGQVTSFEVSEGSAGSGDLNLLLVDQSVPCVQEITLPNPDLTATVVSSQAACASPTDNPLGSISITATDGVYTKAEYNIGTVYAGSGYASATSVTNTSTGFTLVNTLPNPQYTTYYTVRGYVSETLYRDFVVSIDPKVCSVVDLSLAVSPATESANEGEQLSYTVTLTNAGPDPAVNVEVKVDIPEGLELLTTSPSIGDYSPGTQLWTSDLVPVGTHQLSITYRMK